MPLALITEIAAGVVRYLISPWVAALSVAVVPTPPVRTLRPKRLKLCSVVYMFAKATLMFFMPMCEP